LAGKKERKRKAGEGKCGEEKWDRLGQSLSGAKGTKPP